MSDQYTTVDFHIRANSIAELRDKLEHALAGFGPFGVVVPSAGEPTALPEGPAYQDPPPTDAAVAAEAEKPKRTRKAKEAEAPAAEGPTAPTADTKPADAGTDTASSSASPATASPPSTEKAEPTATSPSVTHEQAKAAAEKFMADHPDGKDQAKKEIRGYLATYGVSRVAELAAKDLQSFLSDLEGV
jgi:hypothetical protein